MTFGQNKPAKRETLAQVQERMHDAEKIHPLPPGTREFNPEERAMWKYLMKARTYKEWSPSDLLLATRIIILESVIKRGEERLFGMIADGADILDPESFSNEYHAEIIKMQRLQLTYIRAIGLTRTAVRSTETAENTRAVKEREMAESLGLFGQESSLQLPSFMARA